MAALDSITLNVGGNIYTTSLATLACFPDDTLHQLLPELIPDPLGMHQEAELHPAYVIDRDGQLFRYVLNYLRTNQLLLPDDFTEIDALKAEAEFYRLHNLINAIDQFIQHNHQMTTLYVDERVFTQSGQTHPGNFTDWTIKSENTSHILTLSQIGVLSKEKEVSVGEDGQKLHRCWYDGIQAGQSPYGYAFAFGNPLQTISKKDVLNEVRSLGYSRLTDVSVINDPPAIDPILAAFVTLKSAKRYEFQI